MDGVNYTVNYSYYSNSEYAKVPYTKGTDAITELPNSSISATRDGAGIVSLSGAVPAGIAAGGFTIDVRINQSLATFPVTTSQLKAHEDGHINRFVSYVSDVKNVMGQIQARGSMSQQLFNRVGGYLMQSNANYIRSQRNYESKVLMLWPQHD